MIEYIMHVANYNFIVHNECGIPYFDGDMKKVNATEKRLYNNKIKHYET